jgi:tetratricopeptide (TPR) repeat protein
LIAKRYLVDVIKRSGHLKVREVIFFATPHRGAAIAKPASLFSTEHRQLNQMQIGTDFIDLLNEDWATCRCETRVGVTYVVAGQDGVVSRDSASAGQHGNVRIIQNKNHTDVIKPSNDTDIAFLLVRQVAMSLLIGVADDIDNLRTSIQYSDIHAMNALLINRGRSWIETDKSEEIIALLNEIENKYDPNSKQVVWAHYLASIARLFRDRTPPVIAFDNAFLAHAERHNLRALALAERLEFARKRLDNATLDLAMELRNELGERSTPPSNPEESYSLGVAFYLIANLQRFGGKYDEAVKDIETARSFFRPAILSHQVELAHCGYALAVCRAMLGHRFEGFPAVSLGPEFRRFADALTMLTSSHSAWAEGRLDEAIENAENASDKFEQLQFSGYARRSNSLRDLLEAWRRLELGARPNQVPCAASDEVALRTILGDYSRLGQFQDWIARVRPSRALGLLQFASAYNPNWAEDLGRFKLPPVLDTFDGGKLRWNQQECTSLAGADKSLRALMKINHSSRLPLLAD